MTMLLTAIVAVGMSLVPLPSATPEWALKWLRPMPDLNGMPPGEAVVAYGWPKALRWFRETQAPTLPDDPALALEAEAPGQGIDSEGGTAPDAKHAAAPKAAPQDDFTRSISALPVKARNQARELEALARRVGAVQVDVVEGCRSKGAAGNCEEKALDPFFRAIHENLSGKRKEPVRVLHLGNSLIASDHISDMIRSRLEARYGSGGTGFLFVDRPTRGAGRKVRTGEATEGWDIAKITDKAPARERFGYSGVSFRPTDLSQRASFQANAASTAELFYLAKPDGGALGLHADGQLVAEIRTAFSRPEVSYARVPLPTGVKSLSISPLRGNIEVYGIALESGKPGVILDSNGLPGATAEVYLRPSAHTFATQLLRRNPALVLIMLGGNEAHEYSRGWTTLEKIREQTRTLYQRIRTSAPDAACLVTSPMDAGVPTVGRRINVRKGSRAVGDIQRELAMEAGCAYWDMLAAAGGEGAISRWVDADLMLADLVHPRARGADLLGHLFDLSLERAHLRRTLSADRSTGGGGDAAPDNRSKPGRSPAPAGGDAAPTKDEKPPREAAKRKQARAGEVDADLQDGKGNAEARG